MWRIARPADDDAIVEMCARLNQEDPGPHPVPPDHMRGTLAALRRDPSRGRAVVLEIEQQPAGYALLIAFWSNELGGEVCEIDELFVAPEHRSQGHGQSLVALVADLTLWPTSIVAIALVVTAGTRARHLFERLGFSAVGTSMVRRL